MECLKEYFYNRPKAIIFIWGLALVIFVGCLDYATGYELNFFLFYFFPIAFVTWFAGLFFGVMAAFISAAMWFIMEYVTRTVYPHVLVMFYNSGIRLTAFLILSYSLWHIRVSRQRVKELIEFIVHDLRAPLSNMALGFDNLLNIESENLDTRQKDMIGLCKVSADRMFILINSILDLSRLQDKKISLEISRLDLDQLVSEAFEVVSIFAHRQQVKLEKHIDTGNSVLMTDYNLLVRVFVNLLSNAIRVSPPGSKVSVDVSLKDEEHIRFCVCDQGPGIPRDFKARIFDRFVQLEARKRGVMARGSGLGLAFCKMAVEVLGGRIWLESSRGEGTIICFILPLNRKETA